MEKRQLNSDLTRQSLKQNMLALNLPSFEYFEIQ